MDTTEAPLPANSDNPECPICLNPFTEPKIISCGHILCRLCLITWLEAEGIKAGCPLCRHIILDERLLDLPVDFLAKLAVDSLPTDLVMKATTRGKVDMTPETCKGCENLLCSSRSSPHPNCPGPQDPHNIARREAEARKILEDLFDKVQVIVESTKDVQDLLKDLEEECRGLVNVTEIDSLLKDRALRIVGGFHSKTIAYRTVLLTHQQLLKRMGDNRQVVAIILMRKFMQDRVEIFCKKIENLRQCYMRCSQRLRATWRK